MIKQYKRRKHGVNRNWHYAWDVPGKPDPKVSYGVAYHPKHKNYQCWFCVGWRSKPYHCTCEPDFVRFCWECRSKTCGHQDALSARWKNKTYFGESKIPLDNPGLSKVGSF